jgi:hypothetical protein
LLQRRVRKLSVPSASPVCFSTQSGPHPRM